MTRVYVVIGLLVLALVGGYGAGYKAGMGKEKAKEVKVITTAVKDDNEDKAEISSHITEVNKTKSEVSREILLSAPIITYNNCPIGEFTNLRNETYSKFPEMLFQ